VASKPFAEELAGRVDVPVVFMPQAADHRRFHPAEPVSELCEELLFVGNSRREQRHGVAWAVDRGLPLTVYGREWDGIIPSGYVKAEYVPNEQLPSLYRSAKVVLNDHWPDMREHGFVSNRIFDVLACGGVVVSDLVEGLGDLFGDLVPTYETSEELSELVRSLLDDPERRRSISVRGPELVRAEHTFDHRARELAGLLHAHLSGRAKNIEGDTF
jgi:spore maturation protein CgeB